MKEEDVLLMTKMQKVKGNFLFYILIFILIIVIYVFFEDGKNPYKKYDICFKSDYPGATSRFVAYTPIRCSDDTIVLGESVGTDYGRLYYKDIDKDGLDEIVIEPAGWRCRISANCYDPRRIVMKIYLKEPPEFEIISDEFLEEIAPKK